MIDCPLSKGQPKVCQYVIDPSKIVESYLSTYLQLSCTWVLRTVGTYGDSGDLLSND